MSQGSPRYPVKKAGFDQEAGCTSSRLASPPLEAQAREDDKNLQLTLY
jgi:hypothetical protein